MKYRVKIGDLVLTYDFYNIHEPREVGTVVGFLNTEPDDINGDVQVLLPDGRIVIRFAKRLEVIR